MEYIDLRKVGVEGLKQIRSQVVRLKKMGKSGKEIEELTGVRQNRVSEIWTAYQREGEASLTRKKGGRKEGEKMALTEEEQKAIREVIVEREPKEYDLPGSLWTLAKVCSYIEKTYGKKISDGCASDYMRRWGLSSQRPVKRARKQDSKAL